MTVLLVHLKEFYSLTKWQTTFLILLATCLSIPFSYAVAHFADIISKRRMYFLLLVLGLLSSLLVLSHSLYLVLTSIVLYLVILSGFKPLVRAMMTNLHGNLGAKIGLLNLAENIGGILAPVVVGTALDLFPRERFGFLFFALLFALSLSVQLWIEKRRN